MPAKSTTVTEAYAKQSEGYTYIDVRSEPEYREGHPAGAVNIPLLHLDERTGQMSPNPDFLAVIEANFAPDARLLIGCQMGGRSSRAAEALSAAGYRDVYNVRGGFGGAKNPMSGEIVDQGWAQAGLPVDHSPPQGASYSDLRTRAHGGRRE